MFRENVDRLGLFGPGGRKCACCAPGNSKKRRKVIKAARRKLKRLAIKEQTE